MQVISYLPACGLRTSLSNGKIQMTHFQLSQSMGLLFSKQFFSAIGIFGFLIVIPETVTKKFQFSRKHFEYGLLDFSLTNSYCNIIQLSCGYSINQGKHIPRQVRNITQLLQGVTKTSLDYYSVTV